MRCEGARLGELPAPLTPRGPACGHTWSDQEQPHGPGERGSRSPPGTEKHGWSRKPTSASGAQACTGRSAVITPVRPASRLAQNLCVVRKSQTSV